MLGGGALALMAADSPKLPARIEALLAHIRRHPNDTLLKTGDREGARGLVEIGAPAVRPILEAMRAPLPAGSHPVDYREALDCVLSEIARKDPAPFIALLEEDALPPDPEMSSVVAALWRCEKEGALEAMISALQHPEKEVRYAAASALVERKEKRVLEPLIMALNDSYSLVRFTIVEGMKRKRRLRHESALEPLNRIVANKRLQKHSAGLCDYAKEVITLIERERR